MNTRPDIVQLTATEIPRAAGAPEWLHLLPPAGKPFRSVDGRGPWQYDDAEAVIRASLDAPGPRLFVDIEHSTLKGARGAAAAGAIGDIVEMEARADGLWGRVEWTKRGAEIMADRAYRAVSPVMLSVKGNGPRQVQTIWHVSVTNNPALRGSVTSLSQEDPVMMKIAKALGLDEDASEEDIVAAIEALKGKDENADSLSAIAEALGAEDGAGQAELVLLARGMREQADDTPRVEALETELKRMRSEAWVDALSSQGVGIGKTIRDDVIALHMEDPQRAQRYVDQLPKLGPSHTRDTPPDGGAKITTLTADQKALARQFGMTEEQMLESLEADRQELEAS